MLTILETTVPVFALVALGWLLGGARRLDVGTLTRLTVDVCAPALVFDVFVRTRWDGHDWATLAGGTTVILLVTGALGIAALRLLDRPHRGVLLPILFWNSGNMGLSVVRLGLGDGALPAAAVVFVTVATLNAVVGVWIAAGRGGLATVLRMPLAWACLGGVACSLGGWSVPRLVAEPISMLGASAIPLMLLTLGMTLRGLVLQAVRDAVIVLVVRMGGGLLAALAFVILADVQGLPRQVLLIESVLPPAVINVLFAKRYDAVPETVASAILLGTLLSIVVLPLALAVVL